MVAIVLIAFTIAAVQNGGYWSEPIAETSATSSNEEKLSDQPSVFETKKLNFPKPNQRGLLEIDIERGFVDVVGHDQSDVIIEVLTPPEFKKNNESNAELTRVFAPNYDLRTDRTNNSIKLDTYNLDYALNLRIKVPFKTDLSIDAYFDGLKVQNVSGFIKTRSQHSNIRLLDISGSATAYSYNGSFLVRFKEVSPNAKLDFESYNGNIDVSLPSSISASTAISTGTGSFFLGFEIAPVKDSERPDSILSKINRVKNNEDKYQFGSINGGGIPVRIETQKGTIKLRKNKDRMP